MLLCVKTVKAAEVEVPQNYRNEKATRAYTHQSNVTMKTFYKIHKYADKLR